MLMSRASVGEEGASRSCVSAGVKGKRDKGHGSGCHVHKVWIWEIHAYPVPVWHMLA